MGSGREMGPPALSLGPCSKKVLPRKIDPAELRVPKSSEMIVMIHHRPARLRMTRKKQVWGPRRVFAIMGLVFERV